MHQLLINYYDQVCDEFDIKRYEPVVLYDKYQLHINKYLFSHHKDEAIMRIPDTKQHKTCRIYLINCKNYEKRLQFA